MLIIHQFTTDPHNCAYLPGRVAKLEYSVAPVLEPEEYEDLMNLGCRKFGLAFFRPVCPSCAMCRPIRVAIDDFTPDRSHRRNLKLNADLEVRVGDPVIGIDRLELFRRYHWARHEAKQWPYHTESMDEYEFSFVRNQIPTTEISVWENGVLRGVLITENTPNVLSAVYHYHEPSLDWRGLGTFLILQCAAVARQMGKRWMYLGYFIEGCASMAYKTRYRPCEIMDSDGVWRRIGEP